MTAPDQQPTLAAFLLARWAEDEAVARAASIGSASWRLDDLNETVCWWPPERESVIEFERAHGLPLSDGWSGQTIETAGEKIAPHIARHDPARVLADVAAKKKIVELADDATGLDMQVDSEFRVGIRDEVAEPYLGDLILRALAQPYADHSDFRAEWAP